MSFKLQFQRRFSMAHRLLSGEAQKCAVIHGHNEIVSVDVVANNNKAQLNANSNMLCNFEEVKQNWHLFIDKSLDHAFQLSEQDPLLAYFQQKEPDCLKRLVVTPGDPTTEILCACLMSKFQMMLNEQELNLSCASIAIQETPTNTVSLEGIEAYSQFLPHNKGWWARADLSINDFR